MSAQYGNKASAVKLIKKLLAAPFVFLAAVIILLEDWLWDDLARLAAAVGQLPVLRTIEAFIKLMALYFISHGQATLGLLTVLVAKVAGTALVARIFALTRPRLLRIKWFAWLYDRFVAFKAHVYGVIKSTAVYKAAHKQHLRIKALLRVWLTRRRGFWRRRWSAAVKLSRRRKQPQE